MPREYDDLYPSRDPSYERCDDEECGGSLTSRWEGAREIVTCSRCGKAQDEGEGEGEGEGAAVFATFFNHIDNIDDNVGLPDEVRTAWNVIAKHFSLPARDRFFAPTVRR